MTFSAMILTALAAANLGLAQQETISDPPEVRGSFTLTAIYDADAGNNAFAYAGKTVPPLIRAQPGETIRVHYVNSLPARSTEQCALAPCMNMTNLHFHGLHVSPDRPQDDVLSMMAMPGESLDYSVEIPRYAPPGLYWYHTHPHGESARQDLDGMSGPIVIDGIDRYYPQVRRMRERVIILRDQNIEHIDPQRRQNIIHKLEVPSAQCGTASDQSIERVFTANGQIRPWISIGRGERQFWRIVNASPDRYADLRLSHRQLEIVALDGMPLSYHNPHRGTRTVDHVLVAPAGRVEAIVVGPPANVPSTLSTSCVDTGKDGDANSAMVIADVGSRRPVAREHSVPVVHEAPIYRSPSLSQLRKVETAKPDYTVIFNEDRAGFYINGRKFSMKDDPMLRVRIGSMQHWRIVNATNELHPFHIHQIHFLVYAENGKPINPPEWLDTVNVPYGNGTVDLVMDFTDPIIKGISVFHCHLLAHEDKGMMAKIVFE